MEAPRIAFVASGGGMLCAYGAGVAWALQDSGIKPDIFIGSSGSAGTVSYFACGEAERAAKLWIEEVTNPRVLRKGPLRLDVDFVIDSMRDRFPFDEQKLRDGRVDLYLAATEHKKIRSRYFSNHEPLDWYEVMRASMALPFVYGRRISLDGGLYFDGDVATSLESSVHFARAKGAQTIYVCDTRSSGSLWDNAKEVGLRSLCTIDFPKSLLGEYRMQKHRPKLDTADLVYIKPRQKLPIGMLDNGREAVKKSIAMGYADARNLLA